MSHLSASEINAIKYDDPSRFGFLSEFSESDFEDYDAFREYRYEVWNLIENYRAVNILYQNWYDDLFSEKRYRARKDRDWRTLRLFLDAIIANPHDKYRASGYDHIEYQYLMMKGYDFNSIEYDKEEVSVQSLYLLLSMGMWIKNLVTGKGRGVINRIPFEPDVEKRYPHTIYHLMILITPIYPGYSHDEIHDVMVYDITDYSGYEGRINRSGGFELLQKREYHPILKRLVANGYYEDGAKRDQLILAAINDGHPEVLDILQLTEISPSAPMMSRLRRFVK